MQDALELRRAMLRDVERVVDHQVAAIEQLDGKAAQALTLAVSGLPLLVLLATQGAVRHLATLGILVAAGVVNGLAVLWLLRAHHASGAAADVSVGPSPAWVAAVRAEEPALAAYYDSVLASYARYAEDNDRFMSTMRARRHVAVTLLLLAAALYGAAALALTLANLLT